MVGVIGALLLQLFALLRGDVDVWRGSFGQEQVEIWRGSSSDGIVETKGACFTEKNGPGGECSMCYALFLQMTECEDAAGRYRPQLTFLKTAFLEISLIGFIVEGVAFPLEERVQLEIGRAQLVLTESENAVEVEEVWTYFQLCLPALQQLCLYLKLTFIIESELPQQILPSVTATAQQAHAFCLPPLQEIEVEQQLRVL